MNGFKTKQDLQLGIRFGTTISSWWRSFAGRCLVAGFGRGPG